MTTLTVGTRARVIGTAYPKSAPVGTEVEVLRIGSANTPEVPYFWSLVDGGLLGFYRDELEPIASAQETSE